MPQQIRCFVHCPKQVFLRYLFYTYFDVLKISIVSQESSKLFQNQRFTVYFHDIRVETLRRGSSH
jgi:hypothetical protein